MHMLKTAYGSITSNSGIINVSAKTVYQRASSGITVDQYPLN